MRAGKWLAGCGAVAVLAGSSAARADLEISNHPTLNVSCSAGVCTATADKARLNVTDLANLLAGGDVAVKTSSVTTDIALRQPLSWTSTSRLTLDAKRTVEIDRPMSVTGSGGLTILTNDGGKNGEFIVLPERGSVQFWDLNSSLVINGQAYTLVGDIKTLASDIAANPSGFYALAKDYDASADGTYASAPIVTTFNGLFEGLGNAVSKFAIRFSQNRDFIPVGLFSDVGTGTVRNLQLTHFEFEGASSGPVIVGSIAVANDAGLVDHCRVTGTAKFASGAELAGGLVGANAGTIKRSYANVKILGANTSESGFGTLASANYGEIAESVAKGELRIKQSSSAITGGLVGTNKGSVSNAYSLTAIDEARHCCGAGSSFGGLIGVNAAKGTIESSYSAGIFKQFHSDPGADIGGFVGSDDASAGAMQDNYWDLDQGVSNPSQGAGNIDNDPGIVGLTGQQLRSGLPKGFSPQIWTQDSKVNGGLPYLFSVEP